MSTQFSNSETYTPLLYRKTTHHHICCTTDVILNLTEQGVKELLNAGYGNTEVILHYFSKTESEFQEVVNLVDAINSLAKAINLHNSNIDAKLLEKDLSIEEGVAVRKLYLSPIKFIADIVDIPSSNSGTFFEQCRDLIVRLASESIGKFIPRVPFITDIKNCLTTEESKTLCEIVKLTIDNKVITLGDEFVSTYAAAEDIRVKYKMLPNISEVLNVIVNFPRRIRSLRDEPLLISDAVISIKPEPAATAKRGRKSAAKPAPKAKRK